VSSSVFSVLFVVESERKLHRFQTISLKLVALCTRNDLRWLQLVENTDNSRVSVVFNLAPVDNGDEDFSDSYGDIELGDVNFVGTAAQLQLAELCRDLTKRTDIVERSAFCRKLSQRACTFILLALYLLTLRRDLPVNAISFFRHPFLAYTIHSHGAI
jgi:hypothetical protein